jgi:hypothetical protein
MGMQKRATIFLLCNFAMLLFFVHSDFPDPELTERIKSGYDDGQKKSQSNVFSYGIVGITGSIVSKMARRATRCVAGNSGSESSSALCFSL